MCCSWHPKSSGRLLHDWLAYLLPLKQHRKDYSIIANGGMQRRQSSKEIMCAVTGEVSATACYLKTNMGFLSHPFMGIPFAHD